MKVTTAAALNELIQGNESYKIIHFSTDETGMITLHSPQDEDKFKDTILKIDAPNATIVNHVSFKKVEIIRIAKNTYEENKDNSILVSAPESHIIVQKEANVDLELGKTANDTIVENNGIIKNLEVNTKGKVLLQGTSSQDKIPVKINEKVEIATSKPLSITAEQKAKLILKAGAEGTDRACGHGGRGRHDYGRRDQRRRHGVQRLAKCFVGAKQPGHIRCRFSFAAAAAK